MHQQSCTLPYVTYLHTYIRTVAKENLDRRWVAVTDEFMSKELSNMYSCSYCQS